MHWWTNTFADNVSAFAINQTTGALTALASSPIITRDGPRPVAFVTGTTAVTVSPRFAYTANFFSNNVSAFTVNPTTGVLTSISGSPFPAGTGPRTVVVDPSARFAYAVNEWLYKPTDKVYDVAFLCWHTPVRRIVQGWAEEICKRHGWLYLTGTYTNPLDYAAALCTAKIVIHKQHVTDARSWRVFDVMAAMDCLLSNPIPQIDGDEIVPGWHYHEYNSAEELEQKLSFLLENDRWREVAKTGYAHVM